MTDTTTGRVLLLDLDGTVCIGDGPVLRYAEEVARLLDGPDPVAATCRFLAGHERASGAGDAYQFVQRFADRHGVPAADLGRAYRASRAALVAGEVEIAAPAGLRELLAELAPRVHRVLLTNAPADGLPAVVERLGLAGVVDEAIGDAGKPAGLGAHLDRLLTRFALPSQPWRLMSVGDLWINDLHLPAERGCTTACIDRFDLRQGMPHARAATFEGLYAAIRGWARDARELTGEHRITTC